MRFPVLFLFLSSVTGLFSQDTDEKLAAQYFAGKEYKKAADLYEDLASKRPESVYYYENLLQCYVLLKDFKSADRIVDKRIRKFPSAVSYRVDKAYLCELQGRIPERDEIFRELLRTSFTMPEEADLMANAFLKRRYFEQAALTYLKARKDLKDEYIFAYSLSEIYFYSSRIREGTDELVSIAGANEFLTDDVKNRLVTAYTRPEYYKVLSGILLSKLQKSPDNNAYNELLIWSFTQQRDWEGALTQAKAVDKRLQTQGLNVLGLASVLTANEEYEYAMRCFDHVKSLGPDSRYYYQAVQGLLNCGILQVRAGNGASQERLISLEREYLEYLRNNGVNWQTAPQMKELAELYMYYLHLPSKAVEQLNAVMGIPGVAQKLLAACKLDLGDAMLIMGETWEADLLYKQVEKAFTNDALGQEARYRYARLCYYRGDFAWSQTQLDVLKDATSQLISNNAMRLWLLIQDNTGLDSSGEALKLYARADLLIFQNRYQEAMLLLDSIPMLFPGHTLLDEIYFAKATISEKQGRFTDAERFYLKVVRDFSFDILADNALISLARLYEFRLNDTASARKTYEIIVLNYTGSLYINEARKRYRYLRGDMRGNEVN